MTSTMYMNVAEKDRDTSRSMDFEINLFLVTSYINVLI